MFRSSRSVDRFLNNTLGKQNFLCFHTDHSRKVKEKIIENVAKRTGKVVESKVSLIGVGQVGMAVVYSMLYKTACSKICLIDKDEAKVKGEGLDLQHASLNLDNLRVCYGSDYSQTAGSKICIIAAGVRQRKGETRLDLVQRNVLVMKEIVPNLVKYSPDTIILIVSNPVDILTWVAWKLSGLPTAKVIGSGTNLDSSRFRLLISQKLDLAPSNCHGWIIGEHGDSSVPVWSSVNVAGVHLARLNPKIGAQDDPEKWSEIHKEVVQSAYKVIALKGYTSWAIGKAAGAIGIAILRSTRNTHAVSVLAKGYHGIEDEVYLSLPTIIDATGVRQLIKQDLTKTEVEAIRKSAATMAKVQAGIKL